MTSALALYILLGLFLAYLVRRLVVRSTPGATRDRATRKRLRRDRAKRLGLEVGERNRRLGVRLAAINQLRTS